MTHQCLCVTMKWDGVRTESTLSAPENLSSFQPAAFPSHGTFSSVVMSTILVGPVQDESCLKARKRSFNRKKWDLETKCFVISGHTTWLSGKLLTLSVDKKQTNTLSSIISWCIKTKAWSDTTRAFRKLYKWKGVTHPCMVVEKTENIPPETKWSRNIHFWYN